MLDAFAQDGPRPIDCAESFGELERVGIMGVHSEAAITRSEEGKKGNTFEQREVASRCLAR